MANLAKSGVTLVDRWTEGGLNGRKYTAKRLTLVLSAMGTTTNKIEAETLGFRTIADVGPLIKSDNSEIILATPSYDGTLLLLNAGGTTAAADETGTFRVTVRGRSL